ncbi:olfactory receptor 2K2-like [Centropristis striata]|uniref:olfactory receptor 2K2-like n=1 Tax=Centropristis striata TaxID=184440 RepID=UPI0027E028D1|nr:olfactory receptor 2K2-like [Centropristis striata]
MENVTVVSPLKQPIVFELEGFFIPLGYGAFFFTLALILYMIILLANGLVLGTIVLDKNLHRPMFVMVGNLMVCDLLGATAVLPRIMMHFLMGQKKIAYIPAIAQAFSVHTYGTAVQTILGVMAYDRYIAVCEPLRYNTIMTPARLLSCCTLAWFVALLCIIVLFSFHMNAPLCGNLVQHVYCSNRTILRLACRPTPINNIYGPFTDLEGLVFTWCLQTSIFLITAVSYFRILNTSLKRGRAESSKAFQTCTSHLSLYVLYEIATVVMVVSHRFPSLSQNIKKFLSIMFIILPPALNPIIYGLASKELRRSIIKNFTNLRWRRPDGDRGLTVEEA